MPFTIPNAADATYADQAELHSRDIDALVAGFGLTGVLTGCAVTAQGSPNNTVAVAAGTGITNGAYIVVAAGNVTMTAAHASLPRIDLVYVTSAAVKTWLAGTADANPTAPAIPSGGFALAFVYVPANDNVVNSTQITDKRVTILERGPGELLVVGKNVPAAIAARADYICDGVNDEVEVQAAIDALPANVADAGGDATSFTGVFEGGGRVLLVGRFYFKTGVHIQKDMVELVGVYGNTVIQVTATWSGSYVVKFSRDDYSRPSIYSRIANIWIDGANIGTTVVGIDFKAARSKIENCIVYRCTGDGIRVRGHLSPRWAGYGTKVNGCEVSYCGGIGLHSLDYGEDCMVLDSEFHENTSHGIKIEGAAWKIEHCMTWGNQGNGILIYGGVARTNINMVKIEQNNGGIYTAGTTGVYPSELTISDCYLGSNGRSSATTYDDIQLGGEAGSPTYVMIEGCTFGKPYDVGTWSNQARYAIYVIAGDGIHIQGNTFGPKANWSSDVFRTDQYNEGAVTIKDNIGYNPQGYGYAPILAGASSTHQYVADATTEKFFGSTYTIKANSMRAGFSYRLVLRGVWRGNHATIPTLRMRVYKNVASVRTMIGDAPARALLNTVNVYFYWELRFDIIVGYLGTSGAVAAGGVLHLSTSAFAAEQRQLINTASSGSVAFNTTVDNKLEVSVTFGTVQSSYGIDCQQFIVDTAW